MSEGGFTLERALAVAAEKQMTVRVPADNELFVDIDSHEAFAEMTKRWQLFYELLPAARYVVTPSKTGGGHYHVVVTLPRAVKSDLERCLLQALLGSDPKHELLTWAAIDAGTTPVPTLFFEVA